MWAWLELNVFVTILFGRVLPIDVPLNLFIGTGIDVKRLTPCLAVHCFVLTKEEKAMELDRSLPEFRCRLG